MINFKKLRLELCVYFVNIVQYLKKKHEVNNFLPELSIIFKS